MKLNYKQIKESVIEILQTIFDPEIPVNIYDLGLIYDINIKNNNEVNIVMTLTSPNCPMAEDLVAEVRDKLNNMEVVSKATIELTFEPPWDPKTLSDEIKLELGLI